MAAALVAIAVALLAACGPHGTSRTTPTASVPTPTPPETASAPTRTADANRPSPTPPDEPEEISLEAIRIEVVGRNTEGEVELEAFDARSLLDDGNEAMAEQLYDRAIYFYDRLIAVFPDSRLAPAALFNIGMAHEAKGEYDTAIAKYRVLADDPKLDRDGIDAHLRIAAVQAELERWAAARETLEQVLARDDLTHSDTIEAKARLGYVALEQKDYASAEVVLRDAVTYFKKLTGGLDSTYFVAMAHYYLAQIPHRQFRAMPMRLPDDQLGKDLEAKAQLVGLAYDRYVEALPIRNVYWATASGFQMSQIYKEFWDDIVLAPIPPQLSPEARTYYVEEVHQRVRELLRKAMNGHAKNVELAGAYKASTVWSEASRTRAAEIAEILAKESSGELVTPEREPDRASSAPVTATEYVPGRVEL